MVDENYSVKNEGQLGSIAHATTLDKGSNSSAVRPGVQETMEYFRYRYYRWVETSLTIVGLWPHQSAFHSTGFIFFALLIRCSVVAPEVLAIVKYRNDLANVLQSLLSIIVGCMATTKLICAKLSEQKICELLNRIRTDWRVWDHYREVDILHKYAEQGRKIIFVGGVSLYTMIVIYMIQPLIPKIIDILLRNGSRTGEFPVPLNYYYFDEQKYYFYIYAHLLVGVCMDLIAITPFDCTFLAAVLHGCGIFAAVGHKLNAIGRNKHIVKNDVGKSGLNEEDAVFEELVWCIKRHNEAIEYVNLIESTFSWGFFLTLGLQMLLISVAGYQIVKGTNNPVDMTRFVASMTAGLGYISIECYFAQMLMDHSIGISYSIHSSNWYEHTSKVQNLIYFMMICCKKPSTLTAKKISILGLETLANVFKTSLSCLTLLRSM